MKAVRCHNHEIHVHDVPAPSGEGVRVRVASAGICGSDLHFWQQGFPIPFTLGHEIAGITADGTPVAIEPTVYCGHCERCVRGDYNLCVRGSEAVMGVGRDGGMTEELIVPEKCLVRLPGGILAEDACLVEPLSVAVRGIGLAGISSKHKVAIIGGGTILMLATYWGGLTMPAMQMMMKELRTVTSMAQARQGLVRDVEVAAAALARNPIIAPTLITHRLPLDAASEAFAIAADRKQGAIKVAFIP